MLFNYCMKRLLAVAIFVLAFFVGIAPAQVCYAEDLQTTYVVTANSAVVFALPDISSEKLETLTHKSEVEIEFDGNLPKIYQNENFNFFHIEKGYVLCDLLTPKGNVIVSIPNFNAKTNANCKVFFKENDTFKESEITLQKGEQIFLYEGFDNKKEFNAITFVHENEVMYGYLKTKDINPNGINPIIITCILLILAVLGIIFALVFMKRKKVKIKK